MSAGKSIAASYFDGRTPRRQAATLTVVDGELQASGEFGEIRLPLAQLRVSEPMGTAPRTLRMAGEAFFEVSDLAALAVWLKMAGLEESTVAGLQKRWSWTLMALVLSVFLVFAAYRWGLPVLSEQVAKHLPASVASSISERTLAVLDQRFLHASSLSAERRQQVLTHVEDSLRRSGRQLAYRIEFRSSSLGPNAFALPNGQVVILDALVELAENDQEITAVVAHELGHVAYSHGLRQLIQSSIVSFVVGTYLGDVSSLISGLTALALESNYSRDFEREADDYAVKLLRAGGEDPAALASMLERMENLAQKNSVGGMGWSALSTHPDTAERIRRIRSGT